MDNCVVCFQRVRPRQHALQCNACQKWQHRKCETGMSQTLYRQLCRGDETLSGWRCKDCSRLPPPLIMTDYSLNNMLNILPIAESTHLTADEAMNTDIINSVNDSGIPIDNSTVKLLPDVSSYTWTASQNAEVTCTFNIDASFKVTENQEEESINEPTLQLRLNQVRHPDFQIVLTGSKMSRSKLVEADGYSYTIKRKRADVTYWWCSVRSKKLRCPATIIQRGDCYERGLHHHIHSIDPGIVAKVKVSSEVKSVAKQHKYTSAATIVDRVLNELVPKDGHFLPEPALLVRAANRTRQKMRPKEPRDLEFVLDESQFPDKFLRKDIHAGSKRHILLATDKQLEVLARAKIWYVEATFKIIRDPFMQLFSIHAFVKNDEHETKQLPIAFALMSGRRKKDYKKVFKALKRLLPSPPTVNGIVADFEAGIWLAFRHVYPGVPIHGCAFHLGQAMWRKLQELGLRTAYIQEKSVHQFCRKVMALPFLPAKHIAPAFARLKTQSKMIPVLCSWVDYVESTWITNSTFPIDSWSVFRKSVRTNNDVEGWHRRINGKAGKANLAFNVLVGLLYDEANSIETQIQLVSEKS